MKEEILNDIMKCVEYMYDNNSYIKGKLKKSYEDDIKSGDLNKLQEELDNINDKESILYKKGMEMLELERENELKNKYKLYKNLLVSGVLRTDEVEGKYMDVINMMRSSSKEKFNIKNQIVRMCIEKEYIKVRKPKNK